MERRRSHADRHRHARSEQDRPRVALRYVPQDAGPQRPSPERLAIPPEGDLVLSPSRDVIKGRAGNLRSGHLFELEEIRELETHGGRDGLPPLIRYPAVLEGSVSLNSLAVRRVLGLPPLPFLAPYGDLVEER